MTFLHLRNKTKKTIIKYPYQIKLDFYCCYYYFNLTYVLIFLLYI